MTLPGSGSLSSKGSEISRDFFSLLGSVSASALRLPVHCERWWESRLRQVRTDLDVVGPWYQVRPSRKRLPPGRPPVLVRHPQPFPVEERVGRELDPVPVSQRLE